MLRLTGEREGGDAQRDYVVRAPGVTERLDMAERASRHRQMDVGQDTTESDTVSDVTG